MFVVVNILDDRLCQCKSTLPRGSLASRKQTTTKARCHSTEHRLGKADASTAARFSENITTNASCQSMSHVFHFIYHILIYLILQRLICHR